MRIRDWVLLAFIAVLAVAGRLYAPPTSPEHESGRRPSPNSGFSTLWSAETRAWLDQTPARTRNELSDLAPVPREGYVSVPSERSSGSGTAFAVAGAADDADGVWLTARHVVDGCRKMGLQIGERRLLLVVRDTVHPRADVAVLITRGAPAPVPIAKVAGHHLDGYAVGFPHGQPGAVHGALLGEQRMRSIGRYRTSEVVQVWSERSRLPTDSGSLGGLSGGPLFDGDGRVIGIAVAESRRRGRFYTGRPETFLDGLARAHASADATAAAPTGFTPGGYGKPARDLILSLRVARVICFAD